MTESEIGYPEPLLSYVSVVPPTRLTSTLNEEIEVVTGRLALKA